MGRFDLSSGLSGIQCACARYMHWVSSSFKCYWRGCRSSISTTEVIFPMKTVVFKITKAVSVTPPMATFGAPQRPKKKGGRNTICPTKCSS